MKEFEYKVSCSLRDFKAWGPAIDRKEEILRAGKGNDFAYYIEEMYYSDIPEEVNINDVLAYDDNLYEVLGIEDEEYEEDEEDEEFDESIRSRKRVNESRNTHYKKFLN